MTQKYDRFKDAPWFQQGIRPPVLIGGAGGIGSWLTVLLNRAGFETYVFDYDTLEAINMAGQLYMHKSIGKVKVDALAEIVKEICQDDIIPNFAKIDENTMTNNIVFSAFDNMKARKDLFNSWVAGNDVDSQAIFIDGRLTAEQLTIFCVQRGDLKAIEEYTTVHLFDDSEVPNLPCTMAQTSHGAAMIAAHMTEFFTNWYSIILGKDLSRNVPFFWEYMIPIGYTSSREAGSQQLADIYYEAQKETQTITPDGLSIPEGYVRLDSGELVLITDTSSIVESSSITVNHNMTREEIADKFGIDIPSSESSQDTGTDLTPEEIQEIDDLLNERIELNEQDRREFAALVAEGVSAIPQPLDNSLDFEEENIPDPSSPNQPGNSTNTNDLPF